MSNVQKNQVWAILPTEFHFFMNIISSKCPDLLSNYLERETYILQLNSDKNEAPSVHKNGKTGFEIRVAWSEMKNYFGSLDGRVQKKHDKSPQSFENFVFKSTHLFLEGFLKCHMSKNHAVAHTKSEDKM